MKTIFKILTLFIFLSSCSLTNKSTKEVEVTKKENLDKHVGKLITIKGEVRNTKIRTIIGVDVSYTKSITKKVIGTATGILIKNIITNADKYSANRGNGTFYRLKDPETGFDAEVKTLKTLG